MKNESKTKVNIIFNTEDKYNLLKEGPDYEDYSENYISKDKKKCACSDKCSHCRKG